MNTKSALAALALGVAVSAPALGQQIPEKAFYAGASFGQTDATDACDGVTIGCDEKDTGWRLFAGYQINRNFGLEFGYADLGEFTASGAVSGVNVDAGVEVTAWDVVAVGTLPLSEKWAAYGKLGFYRAETEARATGAVPGFVASAQADEKNTDMTFTLGLQVGLTNNLFLRGEWQSYRDVGGNQTGESNLDVLGVGLLYRF